MGRRPCLTERTENDQYNFQFEFEMHERGPYKIGSMLYRPCWPRGFPHQASRDEIIKAVKQAHEVLRDFYENHHELPKRVAVYGRHDRMAVVIDQR